MGAVEGLLDLLSLQSVVLRLIHEQEKVVRQFGLTLQSWLAQKRSKRVDRDQRDERDVRWTGEG